MVTSEQWWQPAFAPTTEAWRRKRWISPRDGISLDSQGTDDRLLHCCPRALKKTATGLAGNQSFQDPCWLICGRSFGPVWLGGSPREESSSGRDIFVGLARRIVNILKLLEQNQIALQYCTIVNHRLNDLHSNKKMLAVPAGLQDEELSRDCCGKQVPCPILALKTCRKSDSGSKPSTWNKNTCELIRTIQTGCNELQTCVASKQPR